MSLVNDFDKRLLGEMGEPGPVLKLWDRQRPGVFGGRCSIGVGRYKRDRLKSTRVHLRLIL